METRSKTGPHLLAQRNHQHNAAVAAASSPTSAPTHLLSLPNHLITTLILPGVSDAASVGSFLSTCKAAHSLSSTELQADWLLQQRPDTALQLAALSPSGSQALFLELLDRPGVLAASLPAASSGESDDGDDDDDDDGVGGGDDDDDDASNGGGGGGGDAGGGVDESDESDEEEDDTDEESCDGSYDGSRYSYEYNKKEDPPLYLASRAGYLHAVHRLLDMGYDPDEAGRFGGTPLMAASVRGHTEVVERLLASGCDVFAGDHGCLGRGRTALHWAAWGDSEQVAHLLIQAGSEVNADDDVGNTPLHLACYQNSPGVVRLLLEHPEIDTTLLNVDGDTAMDKASEQHAALLALRGIGCDEVFALLKQYAARS